MTYYVATTGSDSNNGTQNAPFLTVQKGVNIALPGDTIIIETGIYTSPNVGTSTFAVTINSAGTVNSPITLKALTAGTVILSGNGTNCHSFINFGPNAAFWVIQNLRVTNCYSGGIWLNSGTSKNISIQNCEIDHIGIHIDTTTIGQCGIYAGPGIDSLTINACMIHDVGRTNYVSNSFDHLLYLHSTNTIITNNLFWNSLNGWQVQTADGFTGVIINNTFFGPNQYATSTKVGQVMLWSSGSVSNVIIRNNVSYGSNGCFITSYTPNFMNYSSIDHNIVFNPTSTITIYDTLPSGFTQSANQVVNPMLVNPVPGGNYNLLVGSPCIKAGSSTLAPLYDIDGVSRTNIPDIGAYEYVAPMVPFNGTMNQAVSQNLPIINGIIYS